MAWPENIEVKLINGSLFQLFFMSMKLVLNSEYQKALSESGFTFLYHPVRVGTTIHTAAALIVRNGAVLDPAKPRVFIAGGAGDSGYSWKETGIDFETAKAKSYELGFELAKRGISVVTGYTPENSIPHQAAAGSKDAKGFTIGIAPASIYTVRNGDNGHHPEEEILAYIENGFSDLINDIEANFEFPSIKFDPRQLKFYELVCGIGTASGDMFVDFAQRDLFNVEAAHTLVAFPGVRGTNDEVSSYMLMRERRPLYLVTGLGGVPDWGRQLYEKTHNGKVVAYDGHQSMAGLADIIATDSAGIVDSLRAKPHSFESNVRRAGIGVLEARVNGHHS